MLLLSTLFFLLILLSLLILETMSRISDEKYYKTLNFSREMNHFITNKISEEEENNMNNVIYVKFR